MKLLMFVLLGFSCMATVIGQSIAPPIAEYRGNKVSGMFEIQNTTDDPMAVTLDTKTFIVDEQGHVQYSTLDKSVQIKMGSSSFILRGHDKRMIFYKIAFPSSPASFSIITTMTKASEQVGMRVKFVLPHMIYVYQKEKLTRADVTLEMSGGILRIHNLSHKLGRVSGVLSSKEDAGGFPIYPDQTREVTTAGATQASVKFDDGFSLNTP